MRATFRWVRGDLLARRGQALLAVFVVAGAVAALVLSATTLQGATNPWQGLFARTRGAHVWLLLTPGTQLSQLGSLHGVTAVAGPYQAAAADVPQGPVKVPIQLRATAASVPAVDHQLVRAGRWLAAAQPRGVVLETSFATALHLGVGAWLMIESVDGSSVRAQVTGIADTADQGFYPEQTPGLVWVLPGLLKQVEPLQTHTQEALGLRLANPQAAGFVAQEAVDSVGENHVISVSTWQDVQQSMALNNRLLGLLLAVFGLAALVAAALAIGNATGGRVLVQLEDIAMLKALGFTPGQVVRMLVAEHCALGAAGIAVGLGTARLLTASLLQRPPAAALSAAAPLPAGLVAMIALGAEVAVALATLLPAWRAGRVRPAAAVQAMPPRGRLSRLARLALLMRMPPALVLGARDAFTRRLRATLIIGGLAIPMVMITIGLGCLSTLDSFTARPARIGLAAALTVSPGGLDDAQARRLIAADPQVAALYPGFRVPALVPGATTSILTQGMGTSADPYPFDVAAGRIYHADNEAVAGQGLLDLLHVRVGQWVRLTVQGVPLDVHIVGRTIETENGGQVLSYGTDALGAAGGAPPVVFYSLVLRHGANAAAVRARLLAASNNRLEVDAVANPASRLAIVRWVIAALIVVLALIGLTNLVTATTVGLRDHLRDVAVLKAIGLTPRQVTATLVTSMSLLALIAVLVGTWLGLAVSGRLINLQGRTSGIGGGLAAPPSAAMIVVAVVAAMAGATVTAFLFARRTARIEVAAILREPPHQAGVSTAAVAG
ncbi:MAG TPA: FtsX-like permease family protein [Streptosporangiaceae bacterium]|nr:FtsX-like permease family protein [Streptosporangiaceae bacterium]